MKKHSVSVVIPAYNEEANIEEVVLDSIRVLEPLTERFEILVMDDASSDRTGDIIERLSKEYPSKVRAFHHTTNRGTNLSLIELFSEAQCELVFFLPADKQILPSSIPNYLSLIDEGADMVLGWRVKRADPFYRLLFNQFYCLLLRLFFGVSFHDAAASDLYKKAILNQIQMRSCGRLLQAEIAIKIASLGYKVLETKVDHYPRKAGRQTGIKPKAAWLSLLDLWRVGPELSKLRPTLKRGGSCDIVARP